MELKDNRPRCLITGATGLIGRELLKLLKAEDVDIYQISRNRPDKILDGISYIYTDLNSNWDWNILPKKLDIVINMAQSEHHRFFPDYAREMFEINIHSTFRLLEYARLSGVEKYIYLSSGGVYGTSDVAFTEDNDFINNSHGFYPSTKICSEILIKEYSRYFNTITLRPFFVYGAGQRDGMLIPRLIENIKLKNPIDLAGENGLLINPTYVTDAANAIVNATNIEESNIFNIAGPEEISLKGICSIIGERLGIEPLFRINENTQTVNCIGDIKKMSKYLYKPRIKFAEGIDMMLNGGE